MLCLFVLYSKKNTFYIGYMYVYYLQIYIRI